MNKRTWTAPKWSFWSSWSELQIVGGWLPKDHLYGSRFLWLSTLKLQFVYQIFHEMELVGHCCKMWWNNWQLSPLFFSMIFWIDVSQILSIPNHALFSNTSINCNEYYYTYELKTGSDKIIYWLGRYCFLLGFIMSKQCERLLTELLIRI